MLIGNLLIGTIAGSLAYVCKVIYDSNRIELDPVIEVDNIVKYEYHPVDNFKQIGLKDKIIFTYTEGEKEGVQAFIPSFSPSIKVYLTLFNFISISSHSPTGIYSYLTMFSTSTTSSFDLLAS